MGQLEVGKVTKCLKFCGGQNKTIKAMPLWQSPQWGNVPVVHVTALSLNLMFSAISWDYNTASGELVAEEASFFCTDPSTVELWLQHRRGGFEAEVLAPETTKETSPSVIQFIALASFLLFVVLSVHHSANAMFHPCSSFSCTEKENYVFVSLLYAYRPTVVVSEVTLIEIAIAGIRCVTGLNNDTQVPRENWSPY